MPAILRKAVVKFVKGASGMHAYKYVTKILEDGKIELPKLPLEEGVKVEVIILPQSEDDLLRASESSLNFWYNDIDDKVWNNV